MKPVRSFINTSLAIGLSAGALYSTFQVREAYEGSLQSSEFAVEAAPLTGLVNRLSSAAEDKNTIELPELAIGITADIFAIVALMGAVKK